MTKENKSQPGLISLWTLLLLVLGGLVLTGCKGGDLTSTGSGSGTGTGSITLSASGSVDDTGGTLVVTVNYSVSNTTSTAATIDWGDGTTTNATMGVSEIHTYLTAGSRTITVTLDSDGSVLDTVTLIDADSDGFADENTGDLRGTDCNDADGAVFPGAGC